MLQTENSGGVGKDIESAAALFQLRTDVVGVLQKFPNLQEKELVEGFNNRLKFLEHNDRELDIPYISGDWLFDRKPKLIKTVLLDNSKLQEELARTMGILNPGESWSTLFEGKESVDLYGKNMPDSVIRRRTDNEVISLGGFPLKTDEPIFFRKIPNKYPGFEAIAIIYRRDTRIPRGEDKIGDLIARGEATLRFTLIAPSVSAKK
jgi:hypothetical protein